MSEPPRGLRLRNDHDLFQHWSLPDAEQKCFILESARCYEAMIAGRSGPELVADEHCECRGAECHTIDDLHCHMATMDVSAVLRACDGVAANGIEYDRVLRLQMQCACQKCDLTYPGCTWAAGGDLERCTVEMSCTDGFSNGFWQSRWPPRCWSTLHFLLAMLIPIALVSGTFLRFYKPT